MTEDLQLPSQVRERILAQHRDIRAMLDQLDEGVEKLGSGEEGQDEWLHRAVDALGQVLEWHMRVEEKYLVPMVQEADGFGPVRAERLLEDHRQQTVELRALLKDVSTSVGPDLADRVNHLVGIIREDMEYEEKHYVNDRLLRDDLVRADAFGG